MSFNGRLPRISGVPTVIECPECKKTHQVTYHGKGIENDTYDHICSCGNVLFTETNRDGYRVK